MSSRHLVAAVLLLNSGCKSESTADFDRYDRPVLDKIAAAIARDQTFREEGFLEIRAPCVRQEVDGSLLLLSNGPGREVSITPAVDAKDLESFRQLAELESTQSWRERLDGEEDSAAAKTKLWAAMNGFVARDVLLAISPNGHLYVQAWDVYSEPQHECWAKLDFGTTRATSSTNRAKGD
jgi:hypothetical protein